MILTASSQESADAAVEKLKEKYPDSIIAGISPNLAKLSSVREAFIEATSKYGCVDILVNNAGLSESTPFTEYTEEDFDRVMDLNVKGVFNATRAASECMIARGNGVIFEHFLHGEHQRTGQRYCISHLEICGKRADSFAGKRAAKGIRVNAVAPGITETDMMKAVPKDVIEPLIAQIL